MALDPLASVSDLEARGVVVDSSETTAVDTFLDVASTIVREAAGSPISQTTSTVALEGGPAARLTLPGLPVQSVSAVLLDGVAVDDWRLASGALIRAAGWCGVVEVTYTHGLPEVPADVVDMVCRLSGQALASLRSGDPMARAVESEGIGDYRVKYADTETGTMSLSDFQRRRLAARFGSGPATVVRSR